jgi:hypothetical protein
MALDRWRFLLGSLVLAATGCAEAGNFAMPAAPVAREMRAEAVAEAPPAPPPAPPAGPMAMRVDQSVGTLGGFAGKEMPRRGAPAVALGKQQSQPPKQPQSDPVAMKASVIIYSANLTMAVFEVNNSLAIIEGVAKELGGFLQRRENTSITVRVPAERFDEAVRRIEKVGDMLNRNISAEDVTEEFADLEVRLKGAKAVQDRLIALLAKAHKVEESVIIERELTRVTSEIERIEGRMKFLKDRAVFSTITVVFQPKSSETVQSTFRLPTPWLNELGLGRLRNL